LDTFSQFSQETAFSTGIETFSATGLDKMKKLFCALSFWLLLAPSTVFTAQQHQAIGED
jgi:hypothetical protein